MHNQLAAERLAGRSRARAGSPHVIGIVSGRGGAGVSLVSTLLAYASAERTRRRTLLVDADPWLDVQRIWLDVREGPGLESIRAGDAEALVRAVAGDLELASLRCADTGAPGSRALVRRFSHVFGSRQAVVVDAGARLEALEKCVDLRVGSILIVSDVDAVALGATHAMVKAIRMYLDVPWYVLFNRTDANASEVALPILSAGIRRFLGTDPVIVGHLPEDPSLKPEVGTSRAVLPAIATSRLLGIVADLLPRLLPWRGT